MLAIMLLSYDSDSTATQVCAGRGKVVQPPSIEH
jgi:hypothetical protein